MFALFGLLLGSWASRIPALQAGLQISHGALSFVLLCGGLGGLLSYPVAAAAMRGLGARKTMLLGALSLSAVLPAIGLATSMPALMAAVLMLGVSCGLYGMGCNAIATRYEADTARSHMSMLHAWGCGGSLAGALVGSLMAGKGIATATHFVTVAVPSALLYGLCFTWLPADTAGVVVGKRRLRLPRGPLLALGVLVLCMAMSENSIADWSGVFLKKHFGASEGVAPLGLLLFNVMMLFSRLFGDRLKARHGAGRLLAAGTALSAAGLFVAVCAPHAAVALAGFAASGLGLALVTPFVCSAAGRQGPLAAGAVGTMGSIGGLMGPPVVGTLAEWCGMQAAIGFLGLLSLVMACVAARSALLR